MQGFQSVAKKGIVKNYNPNDYTARVALMPEGTLTQPLPIASQWIGNGWGLLTPPSPGDECLVIFQEGSYNDGIVIGLNFNDVERPLSVPAGECWLVHKTGSFLKLTNDGKVALNGKVEIDVTTPELHITTTGNVMLNAGGNVTATAASWDITGNTKITGDLLVTGDISDKNAAKGTVQHIRDNYNEHTHGGVQSGGSNTSGPSAPL